MMLKALRDTSVRKARLDLLTLVMSVVVFFSMYIAVVEFSSPLYKAGHCLTNGKIYIRIIEVDEVNDVYVVEQYKHPGEYYSSIDAIDKSWKLSGCWIEGR